MKITLLKNYYLLKLKSLITLKLPILSAQRPANGGIIIAMKGVMEFITAVSSTLIPSSLMWIVRYGYKTKRAAANKASVNQLPKVQ